MNGACQKCGGLLIVERVVDYYGPVAGVRCVNCGWHRRNVQPTPRMENQMRNSGAYK
jgi:hypothetical protein